MFLKYCENVIGARNMPMYIFGRIAYIFNLGGDACRSRASSLYMSGVLPCRGNLFIYLKHLLKINILIYFSFLVVLGLSQKKIIRFDQQ